MIGHLLDSPRAPTFAAIASFVLGLFFTFVWAPHPWTWLGIDEYHDLARALARGDGFNTLDRPWGYALYVAFFYRAFGEYALPPILGQVLINASQPLMLFALLRPFTDQRTAALASLITGVLSFNTVYTSILAADSLTSVLCLAATLCFSRGHRSGRFLWFGASGILMGLAAQFRPNLLLLPLVVAAAYALFTVVASRTGWTRAVSTAAALIAGSLLVLAPWLVRNYQLAGVVLPTSTRGAIQLWYGSLQVGPYLENRSLNPRAVFEHSPFAYTSLVGVPIIVSADTSDCDAGERGQLALVYWTDRAPARERLSGRETRTGALEFDIPGQPDATIVYWRLEPSPAEAEPQVYFVSSDHLGDLDRDDMFADVFDVARHAESDVVFADGSHLRIPRPWSGHITDLAVDGEQARATLVTARRRATGPVAAGPPCVSGRVTINGVFYRRELHMMRRYTALAMDNIRRDPLAFAAAAGYRAVRLFIIRPSSTESGATYQFGGATAVYAAGLVLSTAYLLLFLAGVVSAWRQRSALLALLVPIVYVPVTICVLLTNQRYTITVQPLMFVFVAVAVAGMIKRRDG